MFFNFAPRYVSFHSNMLVVGSAEGSVSIHVDSQLVPEPAWNVLNADGDVFFQGGEKQAKAVAELYPESEVLSANCFCVPAACQLVKLEDRLSLIPSVEPRLILALHQVGRELKRDAGTPFVFSRRMQVGLLSLISLESGEEAFTWSEGKLMAYRFEDGVLRYPHHSPTKALACGICPRLPAANPAPFRNPAPKRYAGFEASHGAPFSRSSLRR